jgi:hypothetical protein
MRTTLEVMKKSSHSPKEKKPTSPAHPGKPVESLEDATLLETAADEPELAVDQFAVTGREEEASSSGHRVEPIEEDDEHNAEKLVEEGLHGFVRASPNHTHRGK